MMEEEDFRRHGRMGAEWSRYADGNVPKVNRNDDGNVNVNRYNPSNHNPNLRARQKFLAIQGVIFQYGSFCVCGYVNLSVYIFAI